ncbi:uncharacterized protein ARMOST_21325 [Armillaria ostoyae]|uniref:Uncharacterized protein n=1 Tax=Armillaria ostoyae TaxID=47428 RepID=A0A284S9T2_ARMOS|nr:uncharacterized protein ARMOST_21325 [Armillaria ostoyae]
MAFGGLELQGGSSDIKFGVVSVALLFRLSHLNHSKTFLHSITVDPEQGSLASLHTVADVVVTAKLPRRTSFRHRGMQHKWLEGMGSRMGAWTRAETCRLHSSTQSSHIPSPKSSDNPTHKKASFASEVVVVQGNCTW